MLVLTMPILLIATIVLDGGGTQLVFDAAQTQVECASKLEEKVQSNMLGSVGVCVDPFANQIVYRSEKK